MRVKTLGRGSRKVLLVYPTTLEEYRQALATLGRAGRYVVTTEEQRPLWGLPDVTADARLVDEAEAFEVLCDAAEWSESAVEVPVEAGAAFSPKSGEPDGELAAVRALAAPGPRVDRALAALESGELPADVHAMLRHALEQAHASGVEAVEKALDRIATAVALPWRAHAPARFDPVRLRQGLDRTHAGLDRVKGLLVEALATSLAGGLLTVEAPPRRGGAANTTRALFVRPRPPRASGRVACLAGPRGTGRTSLALAAAEALGRPHVRVTLGKDDTTQRVRGHEDEGPGCILRGLREAGGRNPVFVIEEIDQAGPDLAEALRDVLDPVQGLAFEDRYLQLPFDLSRVLWIVTAADPGAVPEPVRPRLEVIELPGYTEQEKLVIAEQHLLKRPFDAGAAGAGAYLAPEPPSPAAVRDAALGRGDGGERVRGVVAGRAGGAVGRVRRRGEAWRTAACEGVVRFEPDVLPSESWPLEHDNAGREKS